MSVGTTKPRGIAETDSTADSLTPQQEQETEIKVEARTETTTMIGEQKECKAGTKVGEETPTENRGVTHTAHPLRKN